MYIKKMKIDSIIDELEQITAAITLVISHIDIDEVDMIMDESSFNEIVLSIREDLCGVDDPHRWYEITFKAPKFSMVQLFDRLITCKEEDDDNIAPSFRACPRELQMFRQILTGDVS